MRYDVVAVVMVLFLLFCFILLCCVVLLLRQVVESVDAKADILQWIQANRCPLKNKKPSATSSTSSSSSTSTAFTCTAHHTQRSSHSDSDSTCLCVCDSDRYRDWGRDAETTSVIARQQLETLPWCGDVFKGLHLSHVSELPNPPAGKDLTTVALTGRSVPVMSCRGVLALCRLPLLRLHLSHKEEEETQRTGTVGNNSESDHESESRGGAGDREGWEGGVQEGADAPSHDDPNDPLQLHQQQHHYQFQSLADSILHPLSLQITCTLATEMTTTPTPTGSQMLGTIKDKDKEDKAAAAAACVGYETAEEVLERLMDLQRHSKWFWRGLVESFSDDPRPVGLPHAHTKQGSGGLDLGVDLAGESTSTGLIEYIEEEEEEEEEEGSGGVLI